MAVRALIARLLVVGLLAALVAVTASGVTGGARFGGSHARSHTSGTILFGNISTINNPAVNASDIVNATKAWISYINSHGGVHGQKITLMVCDDQGNPALSIQCANNLIQAGVVGFVGGWSIVFGANALPVVEQAQAAILGGHPSTNQEYSSPVEFPVTAGSAGSYPALALAMRAQGVKTLAGVWFNTPASVPNSDAVANLWPIVGGTKYTPIYYTPTSPDLTPVAANAVATGATGIFMALTNTVAPRMLQALKSAGYSGVVGMTGLAAPPSVLVAAGSNLNGAFLSFPGLPVGHGTPQMRLFQKVMGGAHVPADAFSEVGAAGAQYMWAVLKSIKGAVTRQSVLAAARKKTTWPGFLTHSMNPKFAPPGYSSLRNPFGVIVQYIGSGRMKKVKISGFKAYTSVENGTTFVSGFPVGG